MRRDSRISRFRRPSVHVSLVQMRKPPQAAALTGCYHSSVFEKTSTGARVSRDVGWPRSLSDMVRFLAPNALTSRFAVVAAPPRLIRALGVIVALSRPIRALGVAALWLMFAP